MVFTIVACLVSMGVTVVLMYAGGKLDPPFKAPAPNHWFWKHLQ